MSPIDYLLVSLAALAAGMVNALAGGGTLLTFPMLMAVGVPAVAANVTNTVALCPGYLGATFAQSADLRGQRARLMLVLPAGALGGVLGGVLLLHTGERLFRSLVPYLILLACVLLVAQEPLRAWQLRRRGGMSAPSGGWRWAAWPVGLAAVYGGYFGAGLSVIVLAVLALTMDDSLTRLNALKQAVAFAVNVAAAVFFLFSGQVHWAAAAVMRAVVVAIGCSAAIVYWWKG
jgi:uncharacterized membrane protein YfcA